MKGENEKERTLRKRAVHWILAVLLAMSAGAASGCADGASDALYATRTKRVFGNGITFTAAVRGGNEQAALDEMDRLMEDINSDASLTLSGSALRAFNDCGKDMPIHGYESPDFEISRYTYEIIEKSLAYYEDTNGAFNIAVFPLTKLWGVDAESLGRWHALSGAESPPPLPSREAVEECAAYCDLGHLRLFSENGKYYIAKTHPNLQIDLGAVAKGYAADQCIAIAEKHGVESALINISGNICLLGEWFHPEKKRYVRWEVGVVAPENGGMFGDMCALSVGKNKTLVTSGTYIRYYVSRPEDGSLCVPHIVDGRTGLPLGLIATDTGYVAAADHIISATVICEDSAKADAYATAVCLMPREDAVAFLRSRGLHAVLVTADNRMCLVGVTESDESGYEYFVYKTGADAYNAYKKYAVEEYAVA